jgi:putative membrane-bound dehydrogenase-like protein
MLGRFALVLTSFFFWTLPSFAQRDPSIPHAQDRPPGPALSPDEAIAKMTVPPGFSVELVASEPEIVNPVAMTIDERGRFWITESLEYPRQSAGPGRDRVKILEDTDGDGKADKFTVFAEGLNIPSGIAVGAGGVWVANAPDILFLKDTDGDGKADTKEVVVTGFGRYDTHELPNSLTWGPDGYLYGWNGVFNPAKIDYRGKHYEFTCAVFRIDPKTRDFEIFCEGTSNPWGITWDKEGSAFASACVIDHLWHLTETGYYHRQGGAYPPFTWKLESIVDHKHQKAAYCGITYFDSDAFPEKYRERLFMGNIHAGGINVDRLERNGATYKGTTEADFLQANDAWFMPVVQKVGPDGSLYVLDWYDRYHCYQDANRDPKGIDRLKGRLYRVRYKDTPRAPKFDLARETDDQLIDRLSSPNIYFRETAQRLLSERDPAVQRVRPGKLDNNPAGQSETRGKLDKLWKEESVPRKTRLHAIWALIGMSDVQPQIFDDLMVHDDPIFRAWGVRAAGNDRKSTVADEARKKMILSRLDKLANDPSPDVRVQVAIASRKLEGLDALPILFAIVARATDDPLIPQIVWQNLHPMLDDRASEFVKLVDRVHLEQTPQLTPMIPRAIDRLLGGSKVQPDPAVALLARLLASNQDGETAKAARRSLEILADRLRPGAIGEGQRSKLVELMALTLAPTLAGDPNAPLALDAALAATTWKDPAALQTIGRVLGSPRNSEGQRLQALNALIGAGEVSILEMVGPALVDRQAGSIKFRGEILASLGRVDAPKVAEVVLKAYPQLEPELQPRAVELLTQRASWTKALVDAVDGKIVSASALNVNQIRKLASSKDPAIVGRVKAIWGTVREGRNPARDQVIERMKTTFKDAKGDALAGAVVFKNVCGQCHKIYGEGQEVGPEITLNGRGSYEQLLSNVFDPSLVIGPAYQATTLATRDGRVLTGLVVEDSPQRIVLKLQGGKVETVEKSAIEESKVSPLSLMPEGLEGQITPKELADLFAYITLDKPPGDANARSLPGTPSGIRK